MFDHIENLNWAREGWICYLHTILNSQFSLSNKKFERLVDVLDEIMTVSVHKFSVITPHHNLAPFKSLEIVAMQVYFISFLTKT